MTQLSKLVLRGKRIPNRKQTKLRWSASLRDLAPSQWYLSIQGAKDQDRVHRFRSANFQILSAEELAQFRREWISNDEAHVIIKRDKMECSVRPLWVSVHTNHSNDTSDLYISFIPIGSANESLFLKYCRPQAEFDSDYSFENCDVAFGDWRNYFIGISGCLGSSELETLWPVAIFHEERTLHNPRDFFDLGRFLADPTKERIQEHRTNIYGLESKNGFPVAKNFAFGRLCDRWGYRALNRNNIQL
eukprot:g6315.t1